MELVAQRSETIPSFRSCNYVLSLFQVSRQFNLSPFPTTLRRVEDFGGICLHLKQLPTWISRGVETRSRPVMNGGGLERGRDVHQYGTRGRDNFRLDQHRTTAYGRLPSQVGVRLINRLPEGIKNINDPNQFKARLKHFLVSKAFYSVDEFIMGRWDENFRN
ncbi:hypothetical protein J6590_068040 [Homalodisca vitripennis]|nr:hypothetical protein J6590_068040 [Homalodisca vitripennis]